MGFVTGGRVGTLRRVARSAVIGVQLIRHVPTWTCISSPSCACAWPVIRTSFVRKWVLTALQVKPHSDALPRRLQLHVSSSFDPRLQRLKL